MLQLSVRDKSRPLVYLLLSAAIMVLRAALVASIAGALLVARVSYAEPPVEPPTGASLSERRVEVVSDSPHTYLQVRWRTSNGAAGMDDNLREHDWRNVCAAPCSAIVAADGTFRLGGSSITPSSSFALTNADRKGSNAGLLAPIRLRGRTMNRTLNTAGWVGVGLSFVTFLGSFGSLGIGLAFEADDPNRKDKPAFIPIGLVGLGVTAVLLGVSIPLVLSARTNVYTESGEQLARRRSNGVQWSLEGLRF